MLAAAEAAVNTDYLAGPARMSTIALWVEGNLFSQDEHTALLLRPGDKRHVIRLGFILRGSEQVLFPESLLDDWGHEIDSLELYAWLNENGPHFPRAEIFGFDSTGRPAQCFVREVDLMIGYACYVFGSTDEAIDTGVCLDAILLPRPDMDRPQRLAAPTEIQAPLSQAKVEWWAVESAATGQHALSFLT